MTPTDLAQRTYLEHRREALLDMQAGVTQAALAAREHFEALPKQRLCPQEVARLERVTLEAERRSANLLRAIAAIDAELAVER